MNKQTREHRLGMSALRHPMKPTPKKPTTPRGRVMYTTAKDMAYLSTLVAQPQRYGPSLDVALSVIPHATAKQARAFVRFWNMTPEEQHETIVLITEDGDITPNDQATAILAAIYGEAQP
jgi:hypothetical protein